MSQEAHQEEVSFCWTLFSSSGEALSLFLGFV